MDWPSSRSTSARGPASWLSCAQCPLSSEPCQPQGGTTHSKQITPQTHNPHPASMHFHKIKYTSEVVMNSSYAFWAAASAAAVSDSKRAKSDWITCFSGLE
eukprot:6471394-Amphidinium_carterae.1